MLKITALALKITPAFVFKTRETFINKQTKPVLYSRKQTTRSKSNFYNVHMEKWNAQTRVLIN